ncbi:hypothetical protein L0U85_19575 [Glycomyces sp. L485]|uniref:hypothetical protein n=1 Tax=Glycomyces sp. L485 TaxID=2909235 RepID=UPI001F4B4A4F|nr:hypothetical protein [Glycomyces sp. L485]MCH7233037.1 hypothetical protein [Glycomyces sp. L485]
MSALLPIAIISATLVALFGVVLPLLLLGPVVASSARPQPQQLLFAVVLLIPTVAIGAVFLSWWAVSWLEGTDAPAPALIGISLVVSATVGLMAPLRLPGGGGPFWLKPLLGFSAGVLVPVAIMEGILIGLHEAAATAVGVVVLGVLIGVFRLVAKPLAERRQAKQVRTAVQRFQGQLVDVTDSAWRLVSAKGDANRILLQYEGEEDGRRLGAALLLRRDMDWVPVAKENEAAVFELARGLNGHPTEAVLAQKQLGTPATLTVRIPGTTVMSIRESVADSLSWVDFVGKLELTDAEDVLRRQLPDDQD